MSALRLLYIYGLSLVGLLLPRFGSAQTDLYDPTWLVRDEEGQLSDYDAWGFVPAADVKAELLEWQVFEHDWHGLLQDQLEALESRPGPMIQANVALACVRREQLEPGLVWVRKGDLWAYGKGTDPSSMILGRRASLRISLARVPEGAVFQLYLRRRGSWELEWICERGPDDGPDIEIPDLRMFGTEVPPVLFLGVRGPGAKQSEIPIRIEAEAREVSLDLGAYETVQFPVEGHEGDAQDEVLLLSVSGDPWFGGLPFFEAGDPYQLPLKLVGDAFRGLRRTDLRGSTITSARLISIPREGRNEVGFWDGRISLPPATETKSMKIVRFDEVRFRADSDMEDLAHVSLEWVLERSESSRPTPWNAIRLVRDSPDASSWTSWASGTISLDLLARARIVCQNARLEIMDCYRLNDTVGRMSGPILDVSRTQNSDSDLCAIELPEAESDDPIEIHSIAVDERHPGTGSRSYPRGEVHRVSASASAHEVSVLKQGDALISKVFSTGRPGRIAPQLMDHGSLEIHIHGLPTEITEGRRFHVLAEGESIASLAVIGARDLAPSNPFATTLQVTATSGAICFQPVQSRFRLSGLLPGNLRLRLAWPGSGGYLDLGTIRVDASTTGVSHDFDLDTSDLVAMRIENSSRIPQRVFLIPLGSQVEQLASLPDRIRTEIISLELQAGEDVRSWCIPNAVVRASGGLLSADVIQLDAGPLVLALERGSGLTFPDDARERLRRAAGRDITLMYEGPGASESEIAAVAERFGFYMGGGGGFCTHPPWGLRGMLQGGKLLAIRVLALRPRTKKPIMAPLIDWGPNETIPLFRIDAARYRQDDVESLIDEICDRLEAYEWSSFDLKEW